MTGKSVTPLYEIADQFLRLQERIGDLDLPEEVVRDTMEAIQGELEIKATSIAAMVGNLEATAEAIRKAEESMALRRSRIQKRADAIREYLKSQLERTGTTLINCPHFSIALRDNPARVEIDAASQIPEQFMTTPEPSQPVPDKRKIAAALKQNEDAVPGCRLVKSKRLDIK